MNTPTPLRNSLFAALYIAGIVSLLTFFGKMFEGTDDSFMAPVVMISLLVLSAALMGYLFVGEPLRMYIDGQKKRRSRSSGKLSVRLPCSRLSL